MNKGIPAAWFSLALAACGEGTVAEQSDAVTGEQVPGEEVADALYDAASQSGPAAREVLEDAADIAAQEESLDPVGEPGSFAQDAMQAAGNAASREQRDQDADD